MSARLAAAAIALALAGGESAHAQQPSGECMANDLAALSGWSGIWIGENLQVDVNGREAPGSPPVAEAFKLFGFDAPWNETGWERMEMVGRAAFEGRVKNAGWGFPVMMSSPAPFKFLITPGETAIVSQYRDIRYVFTDGRPHEAEDERWPTAWGDSIGCWRDGELEIETVGVKVSPDVNMFNPPLSENARFVERLRLTAPGRIESEITITDPETLERPWAVTMVYLRHPVLDRLIHDGDTMENDRTVANGEFLTIAPPAEVAPAQAPLRQTVRLSRAEIDRVVGSYAIDGTPLTLTLERRENVLLGRVDPVQPFYEPIRSSGPLSFFSRIHHGTLRFVTNADGRVTGFDGTDAQGRPISGTRTGQ